MHRTNSKSQRQLARRHLFSFSLVVSVYALNGATVISERTFHYIHADFTGGLRARAEGAAAPVSDNNNKNYTIQPLQKLERARRDGCARVSLQK